MRVSEICIIVIIGFLSHGRFCGQYIKESQSHDSTSSLSTQLLDDQRTMFLIHDKKRLGCFQVFENVEEHSSRTRQSIEFFDPKHFVQRLFLHGRTTRPPSFCPIFFSVPLKPSRIAWWGTTAFIRVVIRFISTKIRRKLNFSVGLAGCIIFRVFSERPLLTLGFIPMVLFVSGKTDCYLSPFVCIFSFMWPILTMLLFLLFPLLGLGWYHIIYWS